MGNGRLSRKPEDITKRLNERLDGATRDTIRPAVEARHRVLGVRPEDCLDQDAGSFVGRLRLAGELTAQQAEAAIRYLEVYTEMQIAVGGPKPSGAVDINATHGMPAPENRDRSIKAMEDWRNALKAVQGRQDELRGGGSLIAALDYCVLRDEPHPHMVGWLCEGLNALARHFKIGDKRKAA